MVNARLLTRVLFVLNNRIYMFVYIFPIGETSRRRKEMFPFRECFTPSDVIMPKYCNGLLAVLITDLLILSTFKIRILEHFETKDGIFVKIARQVPLMTVSLALSFYQTKPFHLMKLPFIEGSIYRDSTLCWKNNDKTNACFLLVGFRQRPGWQIMLKF